MHETAIRRALAHWYRSAKRDLPWRRTRDPYAIWISEIMLQQTRVAAAVPYYERFLARFPTPAALADAPEDAVLTAWSGLGYYARARNLQKAARQIVALGEFPGDYDSLLALPGIGAYTAAAIASIVFELPHAVVDGNVRRVIARLTNDDRADTPAMAADTAAIAATLLNRRAPGESNQAIMELGALICLPLAPLCPLCPVARWCEAHRHGTQAEVPAKREKPATVHLDRSLLVIRRKGRTLLIPGDRVRGFWDLPEPFEGASQLQKVGEFFHTILNRRYRFTVFEARAQRSPRGGRWFSSQQIHEIPLSTAAKKALRCLEK